MLPGIRHPDIAFIAYRQTVHIAERVAVSEKAELALDTVDLHRWFGANEYPYTVLMVHTDGGHIPQIVPNGLCGQVRSTSYHAIESIGSRSGADNVDSRSQPLISRVAMTRVTIRVGNPHGLSLWPCPFVN